MKQPGITKCVPKSKLQLQSQPVTLRDFRRFVRGMDVNTPIKVEAMHSDIVTKLFYDGKSITLGKK